MELVGRGDPRVCHVGSDEDAAELVRKGFERADRPVEFVTLPDLETALDRLAETQKRVDPRLRSPLVDSEDPFDCVVCTHGNSDPPAVDAIAAIRAAHDHLPVVLFAEDGDESLASEAITAGVTEYVPATDVGAVETLTARALELVDEHRAERMQALHRERTRRIAADSPEITTVFSPGGTVTYQNPTITEVLGYEPGEIDDVVPFSKVHPDDWQAIREEFYDAVIDSDYIPQVEFRIEDADGSWRTVEVRGRNLLDDPIVRGFVVTTRDITERKERERDLEGYRTLVNNVGEAMYALDTGGYFTMVNDAFLERTGLDREFVEGAHVSTFMSEADIREGTELILELLDGEDNWGRFEFTVQNVEGNFNRLEDTVAVLVDDDGNFRGSVGVIREVDDGE
jgi:PAS domain S-box-containing protein